MCKWYPVCPMKTFYEQGMLSPARGGLQIMAKHERCRWYNDTSGMKRAYDAGKLQRSWIDDYCLKGGKKCIRKARFEDEGYVSPDYVLPDGTVDEELKKWVETRT